MARGGIPPGAQAFIDQARATLVAKGYHPPLVDAAIARARGMASFHTRELSPPLRDQAYLEILPKELHRAEDWLQSAERGLTQGKGS